MKDLNLAITAASYSGNKGAAAMLQSSISQLYERYGSALNIRLMSVYPKEDQEQLPWDFVKVVSCKPQQLLFVAFPLALLHRLFRWCPPLRRLLEKNKIVKAYAATDLVIDEAGISFEDGRGLVMNTYNAICAAVPLLMGVPVVKYSQAMGPFEDRINRFLAKRILPKLKLICARGQQTYDHLASIGLKENVLLCADGAFTMPDDASAASEVEQEIRRDEAFYDGKVVGLSLSSVVEKKCGKMGVDYGQVMAQFADFLIAEGFHVLLIANAARIHSEKPRNNDLMICDTVYRSIQQKENVRWQHREMRPEEIRDYIGHCEVLVGSRFHAMVGALQRCVPVLLIGWSHKYQEVLDMFGIGQYAIDYKDLNGESLQSQFLDFYRQRDTIRSQIQSHYDAVMESSAENIRAISLTIDEEVEKKSGKQSRGLFDGNHPDKYLGKHLLCRKGYAASEEIRADAASGGMVTALLCDLLQEGEIDGAWVTRSVIRNGNLGYDTAIATTPEEIRAASSSVYMDMPLLKHLDMVREFDGKLAVVLTPCMMRSLNTILHREEKLREKIVLKIGLFCSGNQSEDATLLSLKKQKIPLEHAVRLIYRSGHWRGQSSVLYDDGSARTFSYTKTICAYRNAYFFEKKKCMLCQDHFAACADISVGDIWLKEMKKEPIKHSCCIIRTEEAKRLYEGAVSRGAIVDGHISQRDVIRGQKRALVFKYRCAAAKAERIKKQGKSVPPDLDVSEHCSWNQRLAYFLAEKDRDFSEKHADRLEKIPMPLIDLYMCLIRTLLSF